MISKDSKSETTLNIVGAYIFYELCAIAQILVSKDKSDLIQYQKGNGLRHASGPVQPIHLLQRHINRQFTFVYLLGVTRLP